jgi:hypothetical protein
MPFKIVFRRKADAEWEDYSESLVYADGAEAAAVSKQRNAMYKGWGDPIRTKVVSLPIDDPLAWRIREEQRLNDGTYILPPWGRVYDRLEHVDPDDPTKIRFFADARDAHRNRYTSMNPAKFYTRYINECVDPVVLDGYCAKMGLNSTTSPLMFARTADEIERVYTSGPHSCMAYTYRSDRFEGGEHPVRLYGDLDLAVAYIERFGDITARALCWPEKKIFGRIYGDAARIRERFKEEGFTEDWLFFGARIHLKHTKHNHIRAPYVDGELDGTLDPNGPFIRLVPESEATIILKEPNGVASAWSCGECGKEGVPLHWNDEYDTYTCRDHPDD